MPCRLYAYVGLKNYIAELFWLAGRVVTRDAETLCPPARGERCGVFVSKRGRAP